MTTVVAQAREPETISGSPSLRAEGVSFSYGDRPALSDVTIHLRAGSVTALIGPNGSGKTTLLHVLAGLIDPASGIVEGPDRVAYMPHQHGIGVWMPLTVREVIGMGRYRHRGLIGRLTAADRRRVRDAAELLEVADLLRRESTDARAAVERFCDALIYNWALAAPDAHAKNYSLILDGSDVHLAPLYDVISFLPYAQRDLRVVPIGSLASADNEIETVQLADCGSQQLSSPEAVNGVVKGIVLQQHQLVGAHGKRLLHYIQSEFGARRYNRNRGFLGVLYLQGRFHGVLVEPIHDRRNVGGGNNALGVSVNAKSRHGHLGIKYLLGQNRNLQSHTKTPREWVAGLCETYHEWIGGVNLAAFCGRAIPS